MRDWKAYVREHLALENAQGAAEVDVVEEIASQLQDCYSTAIVRGATEEQAIIEAEGLVDDWATLASEIMESKRAQPTPVVARRMESSEQALRSRGGTWASLADILQELRFALRRLRKTPGFSVVVLITLAVGIGANSAIFSLANSVLLQPLPYDEPDRLVGVWATAPGLDVDQIVQSPALHYTYVDESDVFDAVGLWNPANVAVTGLDEATQESALMMTEGVLPALRIQPVLGRRFSAEDDSPDSPRTILLGWDYWQTRFGGDRSVIGQTLRVDGRVREIVGVLPRGFQIDGYEPAIYLPYRFDRSSLFVGNFSYRSVGRLRPDVTIDQATAELARLVPVAVEKFPGGMTLDLLEEAQAAPLLRPLKDDVVGNVGNVLWVLLGTAGIVLLIACANVANLSLVRAEARDRELAMRTALGASRTQLAVQFFVESVALGVLGGVFGLILGFAGIKLLVAIAPTNIPRLNEIGIDGTVLIFTAGISMLSGFLIGLLPIMRNRDMNLTDALKEGGSGAGTGRERHRARSTLVVVQIALALVLLIGSGLMIRSFQALRDVDPGFRDPESVLTVRITIPSAEVDDLVEMAAMHEQIAQGIEVLPGVTSVGLSTSITMDGNNSADPIFVEDFPIAEGQMPPIQRFKWISPEYFETMRNPVVAGRSYTWDDMRLRQPILIVTENFAREYWGSPAEALGRRIATGMAPGDWREIVGVVGNVRDDGPAEEATATVFWPMVHSNPWIETIGGEIRAPRSYTYAIRSQRTGSPDLLRDVRETVWSINSNLPLANIRTLEEIFDRATARTSFTLVMLAIAAGVALLLGTVGVYGVISYIVSQRTREIGVRIALGAETKALIGMVLKHGVTLAGIGIALGLGASYAATRLMSGLLFGVNPADPITYIVVALVLTCIAMLASFLPARRAARVDPTEALRAE